jgi:uncharacterized membrane protein
MITILLWAIMLLFCFNCAGYLHNIVVDVPNWSSGEIRDVLAYKNFQRRTKNKQYFGPLLIASALSCIVLLFLLWNKNLVLSTFISIALLIVIGNFVTTFTLFLPIVSYIENNDTYDAAELKSRVKKWVFYNYIRFASYLVGLVISIIAINY